MVVSSLDRARDYVDSLKLVPHPEGGFFALTHVDTTEVPSPFARGKHAWIGSQPSVRISTPRLDRARRPISSVIYYLLAPEAVKEGLTGVEQFPDRHRASAGYFHSNVRCLTICLSIHTDTRIAIDYFAHLALGEGGLHFNQAGEA